MENILYLYDELVKNNNLNNYHVIEPYVEKKIKPIFDTLDGWIFLIDSIKCDTFEEFLTICLKKEMTEPLISYIHFKNPPRIRLSRFKEIAEELTPQSIVQYS